MTAALCVSSILRRDAWITPANFRRIHIGMTRTELHDLLGRPSHERLVLGIVKSSGSMTVNFTNNKEQMRGSGYRDYIYETWFAPTITISAFVDANDEVVCRYSSRGQRQTVLGRIWPRRRVALAPTK